MKNGLLIWNVVLTLIAGYLLVAHFSSRKGNASSAKTIAGDSTVPQGSFKMAYFEMDSVEANFSLVKDVKAELSKREDAINAEIDRLAKNIQQKYKYYQDQAQAGTMTQAQQEAAGQELKNMDDQLKARKQTLDQDYSNFAMEQMKDIKSTIEEFLKEYNKTKNFSYIVSYEQGLFYFKDSALNITADVIKGLNTQYKPSGKK
jgi:outer membrane protein